MCPSRRGCEGARGWGLVGAAWAGRPALLPKRATCGCQQSGAGSGGGDTRSVGAPAPVLTRKRPPARLWGFPFRAPRLLLSISQAWEGVSRPTHTPFPSLGREPRTRVTWAGVRVVVLPLPLGQGHFSSAVCPFTPRLCSHQEILEEVVRELHKVKEEIIDGE